MGKPLVEVNAPVGDRKPGIMVSGKPQDGIVCRALSPDSPGVPGPLALASLAFDF